MVSSIQFFLTQSSTPIIGDIARFFGFLMDGIYNFFGSNFGIYSLGLSIIVFTIITRLLMLPLAFKQQKSMKEMQVIQPEIKRIQDKYKNKKDQESQQKMQAELSALYQQHGVNPFGGCLPLLIQMPIIFSLFSVLRNIPAYIDNIKVYYINIANYIFEVPNYGEKMTSIMEDSSIIVKDFDPTVLDKVIDFLYQFQTVTWQKFYEVFPTIQDQVAAQVVELTNIYSMFGINLADKPDMMSVGVLIPVLNVVVQFFVTQTSMAQNAKKNDGPSTQAEQTNKTMMYTMPLVSGFFAMTLPAGLGLYWLIGSLFQFVQQLIINKHVHNDAPDKK
jgi:YidC/Oxa1 family membrane protein insertase